MKACGRLVAEGRERIGGSRLVWPDPEQIELDGVYREVLPWLAGADIDGTMKIADTKKMPSGFVLTARYLGRVYELEADFGQAVKKVTLLGDMEVCDDEGNERFVDRRTERRAAELKLKAESNPDWGSW